MRVSADGVNYYEVHSDTQPSMVLQFDHALTDAQIAVLRRWVRGEAGEFTATHIDTAFWEEIKALAASQKV